MYLSGALVHLRCNYVWRYVRMYTPWRNVPRTKFSLILFTSRSMISFVMSTILFLSAMFLFFWIFFVNVFNYCCIYFFSSFYLDFLQTLKTMICCFTFPHRLQHLVLFQKLFSIFVMSTLISNIVFAFSFFLLSYKLSPNFIPSSQFSRLLFFPSHYVSTSFPAVSWTLFS